MKTLAAISTRILAAWGVCLIVATISFRADAQMAVLETDRIATDAGDAVIHPIEHASFVMEWNGQTVYVDPVGDAAKYQAFAKANLILYTHEHYDHLDKKVLAAMSTTDTLIVAPKAVADEIGAVERGKTTVLANDETTSALGIGIEAVAMYNLTKEREQFHPKGKGNGYVLAMGGKRVYISGDTEDTPEMRSLKNIDVAFLCMNLPYTMDVEQAANAVKAFKPKVVYPYHYRAEKMSDIDRFKELLGADSGVEVRLLKWY